MAESTVLDALIAELLSDAGKLHDQIKELPETLAPVLQQATDEIQIAANEIERQTGANIAAAKKLEERIAAMIREAGDAADVRLRAETAAATVEIRTAANAILTETVQRIAGETGSHIGKAIESQMGEYVLTVKKAEAELAESLGKAKNEYLALGREINNTKNKMADIQPNNKWEGLIFAMIGSGVGALAMVIAISVGGVHVSNNQPAPVAISKNK